MKLTRKPTRLLGAIALVAAALAPIASAQADEGEDISYGPIELKHLDSGSETLSADRGYIFMAGPARMSGMFIKSPDADDLADYEAEWREELAEAQEKYPRELERYERRLERARKTGDRRGLDLPIEPTEANFSIGAIELRHMISVGPQFVFDKGRDENGERFYQYLHAVEPGTYTYYGPIAYTGQAYAGMCYCMGTIRFEVKAGEVTSIDDVLFERWADDDAMAQANVFHEAEGRRAEPVDFTVPPSLNQLPVVEADFRAAGKINNFYRLAIRRLPPMEGVLRYERDDVIDVKAEAEASAEVEATTEVEAAGSSTRTDVESPEAPMDEMG